MATSSIASSSDCSYILSVRIEKPEQENIFLSMRSFRELEDDACSLHNVILMGELDSAIDECYKQDFYSIDPTPNNLLMKYFNIDLPDHLKLHLELFEKDVVQQHKTAASRSSANLVIAHFKKSLSHFKIKLEQHREIKALKTKEGLSLLFRIPCFKSLDNADVGEIVDYISENATTFSIRRKLEGFLKKKPDGFSKFCEALEREKGWLLDEDKELAEELDELSESDLLYEYDCLINSFIGYICKTQEKPESYLSKCLLKYRTNPLIFDGKFLVLKDTSKHIFFRTTIKKSQKTESELKLSLNNKKIIRIEFTENKNILSIQNIFLYFFTEISFWHLINKYTELKTICSVRFPKWLDHDRGKRYELKLSKTSNAYFERAKRFIQEIIQDKPTSTSKLEGSLTKIELKDLLSGKTYELCHFHNRTANCYTYTFQTHQMDLSANDFSLFKMVQEETIKLEGNIDDLILVEEESADENLSFQDADANIKKIKKDIICNLLINSPETKGWICDIIDQKFSTDNLPLSLRDKLKEICQIHKDYFKTEPELLTLFKEVLFDAYYIKACTSIKKLFFKKEEALHSEHTNSLIYLNRMRLLKKAVDYIQGIKGKKGIFVIGYTGAGKSTATGSFTGAVVKIDEHGNAVYEKNSNHFPVIGHASGVSETIFAQGYPIGKTDFAVVDCPGFLETKGLDYQLCTSVSLDRAFNEIKSVQACVILVAYHSIIADKASHFFSLIDLINRRFGGCFESDPKDFPDNIFILVTKCQSMREDGVKTLKKILNGDYFLEMCCEIQDDDHDKFFSEQKERNRIWEHLASMGAQGKIHPLIFDKIQEGIGQREVDRQLERKMLGGRDLLRIYKADFERPLKSASTCKMDPYDLAKLKEKGVIPFQIDWGIFCEYRKTVKKQKESYIDQKDSLIKTLKIQEGLKTEEKRSRKETIDRLNSINVSLRSQINEDYNPKQSEAKDNEKKEKDEKEQCVQHINELAAGYKDFNLPFTFTTAKWLDNELSPGWIVPMVTATIIGREEAEIEYKFDLEALRDYEVYLSEDFEDPNDAPDRSVSFFRRLRDLFLKKDFSKEIEGLAEAIHNGNNPFTELNSGLSLEEARSYVYDFNEYVALHIEGKNFKLMGVSASDWNPRKLFFQFNVSLSEEQPSNISFKCLVSNRRINQSTITALEGEKIKHQGREEMFRDQAKIFRERIKELEDSINSNKNQINFLKQELDLGDNISDIDLTPSKLSQIATMIQDIENRIKQIDESINDCELEEKLLNAIAGEYEPLAQTMLQLQMFYPEIKVENDLQSAKSEGSSSKAQIDASGKGKEEEKEEAI